jgi:hypothetical protein
MTKVEYTGCPITMLILQNKPNLVRRGGFQVFVWQRLISNLQFCRKPKTNPNKPKSRQYRENRKSFLLFEICEMRIFYRLAVYENKGLICRSLGRDNANTKN